MAAAHPAAPYMRKFHRDDRFSRQCYDPADRADKAGFLIAPAHASREIEPCDKRSEKSGQYFFHHFPLFTTCAQVYSPSLIKSAAEIPCPRANPSAAFVIFPFSSYAARIEGPRFFTSSSGCASAAAVTITASLLGVA